MTKLEEFNNILSEMETEVSNLKELNEVYSKVDKLAKDYETTISALEANGAKLEAISKEHQTFQQNIQHSLAEIGTQYQQNKQDLSSFFADKMANFQADVKKQGDSFEKNIVELVKNISKEEIERVYRQMDSIAKEYEEAINNLNNSNEKLQESSQEYQHTQTNLHKKLVEIEAQYQQNKQDLTNFLAGKIDTLQTETKGQIKNLDDGLTKIVEELSKNNKQFYKDFEDTLRIKLAESKSETKLLVESELSKMKENFATELEKKTLTIQQQNESIIKKQGRLFLIFLMVSGATIGSLIFVIYRLLKLS